MQKVGLWDGGISKAADAWSDAFSEHYPPSQQQKKKDYDRFSKHSFALGSDSAERAIEGINRVTDAVNSEKISSRGGDGESFEDSRDRNALTKKVNRLLSDLENEKQLREKIERMNEELTLELKQYVGRKNVNEIAKELEADREKLAMMKDEFKKKDVEYDNKFEALRLSENEKQDARDCKKWKQIAETSGEKYDELLEIAQTQKEGLDELCDVFPGAKRYLDRAIPKLATMRVPRTREQIMPTWYSDDARSINAKDENGTNKRGGIFGSSAFLGGWL